MCIRDSSSQVKQSEMVRTVALIFSSGTRLKRVSSHTCTPYPLELSVAVGAAVPGAHPPKAHPGSVGLAALDLRICPKVNTCTGQHWPETGFLPGSVHDFEVGVYPVYTSVVSVKQAEWGDSNTSLCFQCLPHVGLPQRLSCIS